MLLKIILILLIIGIIFLVAIFLESKKENKLLEVSEYNISDSRIKKNKKIVMVADLHNKEFGEKNSELLNKIIEISPDVVMIAGDVIVGKDGVEENAAIDFLNSLGSQFTVLISKGNHEMRTDIYPEQYGDMWEKLYNGTKENVIWLINQSYNLEDANICVTGLDMDAFYYRRFKKPDMDIGYLKNILPKIKNSSYNILLAHNPDFFDSYEKWGADLVFSGHVHGGLIIIPDLGGVVSPMVKLFPKYYKGLYEINESKMLLTGGLGGHTIKFRVNNKPEICVINLSNE